jgi:curved DNA-binding protein CbpA
MNTLYDILGLSRMASPEQIEQAYKEKLDSLKADETNTSEDSINKLRAIREAYLMLSSPAKRAAYDQKLKNRETVSYQVVQEKTMSWGFILTGCAILFALVGLYHYEYKKQQVAEMELKIAQEKAAAEKLAKEAEVQQAALDREMLMKKQQEEAANQRFIAQAQNEARIVRNEVERVTMVAERDKEQKERQARLEEQRAQHDAEMRSRNETARMQRALSIPIGTDNRYGTRPQVTVIGNPNDH